MGTTIVDICNSALIKIGLERINNITDNNRRAIFCNDEYYKQRDYVLRAHPWNFATKRAELAQTTNTPLYEFDYEYQIPSDCLRIIDIEPPMNDYRIEGNKLLSNETSMFVRYISREEDTSLYDSNFADALAYKLAAELAYPLVQSQELMDRMNKRYKEIMAEAKSFNAQEGLPRQLIVEEWTNARY